MTIAGLLFAGVMTCFLLVATGYWYLSRSVKIVDRTVSDVPYRFANPENQGILITIGTENTFVYLNFEEEAITVIDPPSDFSRDEGIYGYPIDHTVSASVEWLSSLIDAVGGIELTNEGETLRYTGVQIADLLDHLPDTGELKFVILRALLQKISENGLDRADFKAAIEGAETDLTLIDCYRWEESIGEMCRHVNFVNQFSD